MKLKNRTIIRYTKDITKEHYYKIIQYLEEIGFKYHKHFRDLEDGTFEDFKKEGYFNIDLTGKWYEYGPRIFTIDNNPQHCKNEIFLKDIFSFDFNYEIY